MTGRELEQSPEAVERRLRELEKEIAEVRERLPAHSVQPAAMMILLDLEDQRDRLLARLRSQESDRGRAGDPSG